jgi:hypothetical protein
LASRTGEPAGEELFYSDAWPARRSRAGRCWTGRRQRELSDRVHAAADECARQHGWEITKTTGRFGFGARSYRDPRFDDRRRQLGRRPTGGQVIGGNEDHECRNRADDYEPGKEAGE